MGSIISDAETHRREEFRQQRRREERARVWERIRRRLAAGARKTFVFLFSATILVFVFSYREELQGLGRRFEQSMASQISRSALQQQALNYEKEVDTIAK